jgi:rod shape determining protein RodA
MQSTARIWRHFDVWLLMVVVILTIAGVALINSAIGGNENLAELIPRQAIFAAIGLAVVLVAAAIDYRFWAAVSHPIYLGIVAVLALIFIGGFAGFGAARWFNVGIVNIQPSEPAKVLMIIVLADYFARNKDRLHKLSTVIRSLFLVGVPFVLVLLQPDLSTAAVLLVIWAALVWAAGVRSWQFGAMLGIALVLGLILLPFLGSYFLNDYAQGEDFLFLRNYQMSRVVNFLFPNPEQRFGDTYNVEQALISIGSGGLLGKGYGNGTQVQLRFLKVRHTDFIFSAMSEEFGFFGAVLFLALFLFVIFRCLRAAANARDTYGALICYGVAILLLFQGSFNVGMNLNLFPVSGLPLPFLSYGGSSLISSLLGIGLVESVILRHKRIQL